MDPYIGEIRIFAGDYAPIGWAICDGSMMSIRQNQTLYAVIGNTYGGDFREDQFALPNLLGKAPMGQGSGPGLTPRRIGAKVGETTQTLGMDQIPYHSHVPRGSSATGGSVADPSNAVWSNETVFSGRAYGANASVEMNQQALSLSGGNQSHNNMQPFLALNFIIALEGVFPPKG